MGITRKLVRRATPRTVRHAMHPVRTAVNRATPRPIHRARRAVYTVTNPLGALESAVIFGAGPPQRRSRGQSVPSFAPVRGSTGIRAAEAAKAGENLESLFAVCRERFAPAQRPVIDPPAPVDPQIYFDAEWARRRKEESIFRPSRRRRLRAEVSATAEQSAIRAFEEAQTAHRQHQAEADRWWAALTSGDSMVVTSALKAAFADNPAPVIVGQAGSDQAWLILIVPRTDVLPEKMPHVTATGRISSKAWSKTDFNDTYSKLLGAHLLATLRETWAVAPSIETVRVIGQRSRSNGGVEWLFDIEVKRDSCDWSIDTAGDDVLTDTKQYGLKRKGQAKEVQGWSTEDLRPDLAELVRTLS